MFFINLEVESPERFDLAKFMSYDEDLFDPLDSFFFAELPKLASRGQYVVQGEEFRPDLISFRFYGTTGYWWMILMYNNLLSVGELVNGMVIDLPSQEDVSRLYFRLRSLDQAQGM